jgi:ribosomal protein S18 acetylase RimI-like enzyme
MIRIEEAISPVQISDVRALFREYAAEIGIDLGFQNFENEVQDLPGKYAPPAGGLFLAVDGDRLVGCVAVRPLVPPRVAEMKRLFVRPDARRVGAGKVLAQHAITFARTAGYHCLRLDTLATMTDARRLYRSLGFIEIPPYTFNPFPDAVYMELELRPE